MDMKEVRDLLTLGYGESIVEDIQDLRKRIVCKVSPKGCIESDFMSVLFKIRPLDEKTSGVLEQDIQYVWDELRMSRFQEKTFEEDVTFIRDRIVSPKGISLEQDIRDTRRMIVSTLDEGGSIVGDLYSVLHQVIPVGLTAGVLERDIAMVRQTLVPRRLQESSLLEDVGDPSAKQPTTGLCRLIKNDGGALGTLNGFEMKEFDEAKSSVFEQLYQFIRVFNQKPYEHDGAKYISIPYGNYKSLREILAAMNHDFEVKKSDKSRFYEKH